MFRGWCVEEKGLKRSVAFWSLLGLAICLDGEVSRAMVWILSNVVLGLSILLCGIRFLMCVVSGKVLSFNLGALF